MPRRPCSVQVGFRFNRFFCTIILLPTHSFFSPFFITRVFLITALISGAVFLLTTFAVYRGKFTNADFTATVKIQDKFPPRYDDNVALVVDMGSMEVQGVLFVILIVLLPLRKRDKFILLCVYGAGLIFVLIGKSLLHHPAPPFMFQRLSKGLPFPSMHVQVEYSYPSGHTFRTVFTSALLLATALITQKKRLMLSVLACLSSVGTLLVLVGLIVLGKHWTSDVIGGASLAISLVSLTFFLGMLGTPYNSKKISL